MPNWCGNKLVITGDSDNLEKIAAKLEDTSTLTRGVAERIRFILVLARAGVLRPVVPFRVDIMPWLEKQQVDKSRAPENVAYTKLLARLTENQPMSQELVEELDGLIKQIPVPKDYKTYPEEIKKQLEADRGYLDCFDVDRRFKEVFHEKVERRAGMLDLFLFIVPTLREVTNAFSTSIYKGEPSGYDKNCSDYGTKWTIVESDNELIRGEDGKLSAVVIKSETAWSPYTPVAETISLHYLCEVEHTYLEEGNNYCGVSTYEYGQCTQAVEDEPEAVYDVVEDEYVVVGPEYLITAGLIDGEAPTITPECFLVYRMSSEDIVEIVATNDEDGIRDKLDYPYQYEETNAETYWFREIGKKITEDITDTKDEDIINARFELSIKMLKFFDNTIGDVPYIPESLDQKKVEIAIRQLPNPWGPSYDLLKFWDKKLRHMINFKAGVARYRYYGFVSALIFSDEPLDFEGVKTPEEAFKAFASSIEYLLEKEMPAWFLQDARYGIYKRLQQALTGKDAEELKAYIVDSIATDVSETNPYGRSYTTCFLDDEAAKTNRAVISNLTLLELVEKENAYIKEYFESSVFDILKIEDFKNMVNALGLRFSETNLQVVLSSEQKAHVDTRDYTVDFDSLIRILGDECCPEEWTESIATALLTDALAKAGIPVGSDVDLAFKRILAAKSHSEVNIACSALEVLAATNEKNKEMINPLKPFFRGVMRIIRRKLN